MVFFLIANLNQLVILRLSAKVATVYLYSFAHAFDDPSCEESWGPPGVCGFVFHSSEVPFIFRTDPLIRFVYSQEKKASLFHMQVYAHAVRPCTFEKRLLQNFMTKIPSNCRLQAQKLNENQNYCANALFAKKLNDPLLEMHFFEVGRRTHSSYLFSCSSILIFIQIFYNRFCQAEGTKVMSLLQRKSNKCAHVAINKI